eukprot:TRINITY_DN8803_c0_g2_i2.p1 TRINITY_DN8803_c0_g2~~TRINITY_DN8803_c0_g2_i2.p1  ORF type:complete len:653 (-),score=68.03 TRINITY_DN8803_c0_g2_i2:175-2133(-)
MYTNQNDNKEYVINLEKSSERLLLGNMSERSIDSGDKKEQTVLTRKKEVSVGNSSPEGDGTTDSSSQSGPLRRLLTKFSPRSPSLELQERGLQRSANIRRREIEAVESINDDVYDTQQSQSQTSWRIRWFGSADGLIHPGSTFRKSWDVFLVFVIFYTCFQAPFKWAFEPPLPSNATSVPKSSTVIAFYVIELIIDVIYMLDLIFNSKTGYFALGGAVMDKNLILKHYFKVHFWYDLLACVPFLFNILYPFTSYPLAFRFVKLLTLLKLYGYYGRQEIISEAIANQYTTLASSILALFCALLVICNWLACIWFFTLTFQSGGIGNSWLGTLDDLSGSVESWLASEQFGTGVSYYDRFQLYVASYYWASSAGDGFDATTTAERIVSIIGQFLVVNGMGAFIIASIMRAIDDYDVSSQKYNMYRRKIDGVNAFMNQHSLPRELQSSVRRFYHEVWTREKLDFTETQMLEELPGYLRQPIMQQITRQMISTSQFFSEYLKDDEIDADQEKIWADAIAGRLRPRFATPMEYILKQGDQGTDMFMIKQGKVAVEVDGKVVAFQSSGSYFGDIALIGNTYGCTLRTASIRAITYCELFMLAKEDLEPLWQEFPYLRVVMERVAHAKLARSRSNHVQDSQQDDDESTKENFQDDANKSE